MKKNFFAIITAVIICVFALPFLSACKKDNRPKIVVTIYPVYDWVVNILGEDKDNYDLILLQNDGGDLHSYDPTAVEIGKISDSAMFIYVGGESDLRWTGRVLDTIEKKDRAVLNLMELLGSRVLQEEEIEGEEEHEHEEGHDHDDEEVEYDEHVWLSLKNTDYLVGKIAEELGKINGEKAQAYIKNANDYRAELSALDNEYETAVGSAAQKVIVVADRFPFLYMAKDYGITYFAAFSGCSSETDASTSTITRLVGVVNEYSLNAIIKLEGSNGRTAESVKSGVGRADLKILSLDSLQNTTLSNGRGYLTAMRNNLTVLKTALGLTE